MNRLTAITGRNGLALLALIAAGLAPSAFAATAPGTAVSNTVTLDYEVNSIAQTQLSDTVNFQVDRLLNLDVQEVAATVNVTPGQVNAVRAFDVTNLGNDTQDVSLTVADVTGDDFDEATALWVDGNADDTFNTADDDNQAYIDGLAPGATIRVFVVSTINVSRVDAEIDGVHLLAQVAEGAGTPGADITTDDSGTADNASAIDDVFGDEAGTAAGDAARDGKHSASAEFEVASATLVLTKTSDVIDDGIAGTSTNLKRIPGATVRYYLTVQNTGSTAAASLLLSDTFDANTAFVPGSMAREDDGTTDCDDASFTDADDADGGDFDGTDTVEFEHATLAAGSTVRFCVDVTID